MKFGICCGIDGLPVLKENQYDYCELNFSKITTCTKEEFEEVRKEVEKWEIPAEAFNGFFPSSINLNHAVDYDQIRDYCRIGFARAKALGGKVAVLGSSGSRKIPEGYDRALAAEQFVRVLRICGEEALRQEMVVAVEPLRPKECNFINTVAEGMEFVEKANHSGVKCLADFFHVSETGESLTAIETAGDRLVHIHLALPETRFFPTGNDKKICEIWRKALNCCGYNARISLEGKAMPDFETAAAEAKTALEYFR